MVFRVITVCLFGMCCAWAEDRVADEDEKLPVDQRIFNKNLSDMLSQVFVIQTFEAIDSDEARTRLVSLRASLDKKIASIKSDEWPRVIKALVEKEAAAAKRLKEAADKEKDEAQRALNAVKYLYQRLQRDAPK